MPGYIGTGYECVKGNVFLKVFKDLILSTIVTNTGFTFASQTCCSVTTHKPTPVKYWNIHDASVGRRLTIIINTIFFVIMKIVLKKPSMEFYYVIKKNIKGYLCFPTQPISVEYANFRDVSVGLIAMPPEVCLSDKTFFVIKGICSRQTTSSKLTFKEVNICHHNSFSSPQALSYSMSHLLYLFTRSVSMFTRISDARK